MQALHGQLLLAAPALRHVGAKSLPGPPCPPLLLLHYQPQQAQQPLLLLSSNQEVAQLERIQPQEELPPPSPAEGPTPLQFAFASLLLLLLFWIGNFVVPDYVLKNILQPYGGKGKTNEGAMDDGKKRVVEALVGGKDKSVPDVLTSSKSSVEQGASKSTGFGKASKQSSKDRNVKKV